MSISTSRLKRYFRSGHVSMTPAVTWSALYGAQSLLLSRRATISPSVIPGVESVAVYPEHDKLSEEFRALDTFNGSAAIAAMVSELSLGAEDSVLLPAYCCGAELGPFRHAGCQIHFYDIKLDLSVDKEQIERCVAEHPSIRLLFVTHYFGVSQPQVSSLTQWCGDKGILLVEDCAHALYSLVDGKPVGSEGDYAIFSQRKSLPLTEGGKLVSRAPLKASTINASDGKVPLLPRFERLCYSLQQGARCREQGSSAQLSASALCKSAGAVATIAIASIPSILIKLFKAAGRTRAVDWLTPDVEGEDAVPIYTVGSSALSRRVLSASDVNAVVTTRRDNYARWLMRMENISQAQPLIEFLPEGCCPLYFPVIVSEPSACVDALAQADIEAYNWWQHTPVELSGLEPTAFPVALKLKRSVVALPVHQFVTIEQIDRMSDVLSRAVSLK